MVHLLYLVPCVFLMPGKRKLVQIKEIIRETPSCKTFVLESLDGSIINYKAGQFLTFIFDTPSGEQRRNYSLSSSPVLKEPVSITVKRIDNGLFSRKLVDTASPGDLLTTIGANGFFTLPGDMRTYRQLFLMAAGSGITPVFSILKTVLYSLPHMQVILIYSNRSKEDSIFYNILRQLEQQYPLQLKIEWLFSNVFDHTRSRLSNWLLNALLEKYITAPLPACLFYLCGPFSYMRMIAITLLSAGVKTSAIRKEEFVTTPPHGSLRPPDTSKRQVIVKINNGEHDFSSEYPQTILQAAKQVGVELPFSCETGRCGACAAVCIEGNVWMRNNEVLTDDDLRKKRVLTCTGYPVYGDVKLDFDNI